MGRFVVAAVLCVLAAGAAAQQSGRPAEPLQQPVQAPQIQPEQRPQGAAQPEQAREREPQATAQPAPVQPSVLPSGPNREGQAKAENGGEEGTEFWPTFLGLRLKITDTILAVFTAGLFFATYALWLATRALVRGADKTAERQLRAYMSIEDAGMVQDWPGHDISVSIKIKNYGQTPAFKVRSCIRTAYGPANSFPFASVEDFGSTSIVGPTACIHMQPTIHLTADKLVNVLSGECRLFVWGKVTYEDTFGRERYFSFRAHGSQARHVVAPGGQDTYVVMAVSPERDGYQAN